MTTTPKSSRPTVPKGQIPRNPWRHLSDVRDAPNMRRRRIERRYRSLGVEIGAVDRAPRLSCYAMHAFPPAAAVVYVDEGPPGTFTPIPLCEGCAKTHPFKASTVVVPVDKWEGSLAAEHRPLQLDLDSSVDGPRPGEAAQRLPSSRAGTPTE